ncbi:MAG: ATP-binding protein [Clostridia bacterium]|nr:ATP-binding protein [Clostridia bacterium]MBQ6931655.1 ATP-binding protein [Clostridia bacterium]
MPKVYLICGKICCGKTTYANKLCNENNAVLLSVDEITLALFGQHTGDKHDEYVERTEKFLLNKSLELIRKNINVVLDWGFWTKAERTAVKEFYKSRNIEYELHYVDISDEVWKYRLNKRNSAVLQNETSAYYVDDNLALKFASIFESPSEKEIDMVYCGEEK